MRSFECLFLPHNLSADSLFCALYFVQFLHIWGQLFGSYVSECLLYLLHGVLGLVFWIGYADFFYLIKYLIMSSQIRRADLLSVCLRPQTKTKQQSIISKHKGKVTETKVFCATFEIFIRKMN